MLSLWAWAKDASESATLFPSRKMRERLHEGDKRDLHDRVKYTKFQGELPVWMKCNKTWASSSIHERGMPNWEARSKPVINARASACMFLPEKNSLTLVIPDNTTPVMNPRNRPHWVWKSQSQVDANPTSPLRFRGNNRNLKSMKASFIM